MAQPNVLESPAYDPYIMLSGYQTCIFSKEGKFLREVAPEFVFPATLSKLEHPDYKHIQCPALAIYARHSTVHNGFPFYARLDSADRTKAIAAFPVMTKFSTDQEALFRKEVAKGTVMGIKDANHYVFISHPTETEKLIRDFLN